MAYWDPGSADYLDFGDPNPSDMGPPPPQGQLLTPGVFTNTAAKPFQGPSGVPDPKYPGYDTAGYRLGSTYNNQTDQLTVPNTATGMTTTTGVDPLTGAITSAPSSVASGGGPPWGGDVAPFSGAGSFTLPTKPDVLKNPFVLPTYDELIANDPGFEARFNMGLQSKERSAAAQGSLLNGGTLKALTRYGQDYGSNEYSNYVNQLAKARGINELEYQGDVNNALNQFGARYAQYLDLINNNRNARNDFWSQQMDLVNAGLRAATAGGNAPGASS